MRLIAILWTASILAAAPALRYASYFGGNGNDSIARVAPDPAGNVYIAGTTSSTNLPVTAGAFQRVLHGGTDAFVAKLNPAGTALIYCTYLGGAGQDGASDLAVDADGYAHVTGTATSSDFPTSPGAFRTTSSGGAFVAKLNPSGAALAYSTYLDSARAESYGIALDKNGNAYVVGTTYSSDFPTSPGAIRRTPDSNDIFVAKLNPSGTGLVYSTLVGGSGLDTGIRIALDDAGNAFVAGVTASTDFPVTAGAFQKSKGSGRENAVVFKLNSQGAALIYATYLGGGTGDGARGLAVDSAGNAYVTGITYSADFPTTVDAYRRAFSGNDGFVAKLNAAGTSLVYSTFLGATSGNDIALRSNLEAYVTGTASNGFFTTPDAIRAAPQKFGDAFVVRLNAAGTGILYATCLGGSDNDGGSAVAVDPTGGVYVAGTTLSNDFATSADGLQRNPSGGINGDSFLARISEGTPVTGFVTVSAASFSDDQTVAPGSIASGFGQNLAARLELADSVPLPATLGGATVRVQDSAGAEYAAPLFFVSPAQINFLVPEAAQRGLGTVTVLDGITTVAAGWIQIDTVAPALFSQNGDGKGVAAAMAVRVAVDGTQTVVPAATCGTAPGSCMATPIDLGDTNEQVILLLYGTGIRGRTALDKVRVQIGGTDSEVQYAGAQGEYPGLDQVNVKLPRALASRGEVAVALTAEGRAANPVTIRVRYVDAEVSL